MFVSRFRFVFLGVFLFFVASLIATELHAQPPADERPKGLAFNNGAFPGYNLFTPFRGYVTYLIDNDGNLVHQWVDPDRYGPGASTFLRHDGCLFRASFVDGEDPDMDPFDPNTGMAGGKGGLIRLYDWKPDEDGNAVVKWQYRYSTSRLLQHHDFRLLPNGNLLVTAWEKSDDYSGNWEHLIEVKPNYRNWDDSPLPEHGVGGTIVWEWRLLDHLLPEGMEASENPQYWDPSQGAPRINAVDYDPLREQILLSAQDEIWVIQHRKFGSFLSRDIPWLKSKDKGILYRWGEPSTYGVDAPQTSFFQHGVRWLKPISDQGYFLGREGKWNVLLFNNRAPGGSRVDEFKPPRNRRGKYRRPASGEAFAPDESAWSFNEFAANQIPAGPFLGSAQRFPNGHTLVCSGPSGTFFEVTKDGEIVWKFINPVYNLAPPSPGSTPVEFDNIVAAKDDTIPGGFLNMSFRCLRYSPWFPGFRGKDLSPKGELIGESEVE